MHPWCKCGGWREFITIIFPPVATGWEPGPPTQRSVKAVRGAEGGGKEGASWRGVFLSFNSTQRECWISGASRENIYLETKHFGGVT